MSRNSFSGWLACAALIAVTPAFAQAPQARTAPLEMFGVPLKGATQIQLRATLDRKMLRIPGNYTNIDVYDPTDVMDGATRLEIIYTVDAMRQFVKAAYMFPPAQIVKVEHMAATKYGSPDYHSGSLNRGAIDYRWNFAGGMTLEVFRDAPNTTAYLVLRDPVAD